MKCADLQKVIDHHQIRVLFAQKFPKFGIFHKVFAVALIAAEKVEQEVGASQQPRPAL